MDRKGVIILIASFGLLILWTKMANHLYPPIPVPESTNRLAFSTNLDGTVTGTNVPAQPAPETSMAPDGPEESPLASLDSTAMAEPDAPETTLVLENKEVRLTFTSQGGGIKLVELKNHHESISCRKAGTETSDLVTLNTGAPLPVMSVLAGPDFPGRGAYQLSQRLDTVMAQKQLSNGLFLVKEFELGSNFLINVRTRLENRGEQTIAVPARQWITGTATPINSRDNAAYMGAFWYDGKDAQHLDTAWFANRTLGCIPGTPRERFDGGMDNVRWSEVHNQFYSLVVMPETPAQHVSVVQTDLPKPSLAALQADSKIVQKPFGFTASLMYPGTNLAARASLEHSFLLYAGPKEYNSLARLGQRMGNNVDKIMEYDGFFGFFAKVLLLSMNGIHNLLGFSYGICIIIITIIIKVLFWPLTNASTKSMKRMAILQPQMKALQEKYKEDPAKMNRKLMEFMKEHKVSPLGGCLPMLLQIPVFFGFFQMIRSATELRGAQFLWACDLSKPDTIFSLGGFDVNPLPIIMGVTMLWQARLTPPSPGMDPAQQKIMRYMPLMFLFILYNFSAGLTLYWTVQNVLTIIQTKLTKAKDDPASPPSPGAPAKPRPAAGTPPSKRSGRKRR